MRSSDVSVRGSHIQIRSGDDSTMFNYGLIWQNGWNGWALTLLERRDLIHSYVVLSCVSSMLLLGIQV